MQGPWDKYGSPDSGQGTLTRITPPKAPKVVDPYDANQDAIKNANEAERLRMARDKEQRDREEYERKRALGPQGEATVDERKASSFLRRAENAESNFLNIDGDMDARGQQPVGPRSAPGQFVADVAPGIKNSLPTWLGGNDTSRQLADQAEREFIAAILRYDSGAAIPPQEFVTSSQIYFPRPGDGPEVIAQKARARRTAIEGLRASAGRAVETGTATPEAVSQVGQWAGGLAAPSSTGGLNAPASPQGTPPSGGGFLPGATMDNVTFDMDTGTGAFGSQLQADRLNPQQQAALDAFLKANSGNQNFGPEQLGSFYKSIGVEGSIPASPDFFEAVRSGQEIDTTPDPTAADRAVRERAEGMARDRYGEDYSTRASSLLKGITGGWSDELAGGIGAIANLAQGENPIEGYQRERDIERSVQQKSRDNYGVKYELAGGLAMPLGFMKAPKTVGEFALQGAKVGAVAGAGEGEGGGGTITGAIGGAGLGGLTGAGIGKAVDSGVAQKALGWVGDKASRLGSRNPGADRAVIEAGERQGIPIRLADAVPEKSRELAVLESSPNVGQKVSDTLAADVEAFGNRVSGLGAPGRALDTLPRGDMLQKAAGRYITRTRQKARDNYDRAKALGGDEVVDAAPFIQDVDNRIAQLKANGEEANGGVISMLESMKRDLAGGISVPKLQAQRTTLRSRLDKAGLTMDPNQAQLNDALGVAADTLKGGLSKPAAREALSEADAFYADRQKFIGGVLKHFTDRKGNISPETAAKRFDQFLKEGGNFRVVQKMFDELEPAERATISASVAQSLGRNAKGEFSLPIFINNITGKSATLSNRTKFLLFGKDGVRALKDLETIARAKVGAESGFNRSRSATTAQGGFRLRDSLMSVLGLGGAVGAGGDAATTLAAGAAAYGASRGISKLTDARKASLFLNPKFTTWLKNAPESQDPAVISKYMEQLNKIASRDQAFLMDANAISDFVRRQMSEGVGRAAATGDQAKDDGRK